jgi:hypothetical protein
VRASHDLSRVAVSFDEPSLVPSAGLLPAPVLAQRIDLSGLVEQRVTLARYGANSGAKALTVIARCWPVATASMTPVCSALGLCRGCSTTRGRRRRVGTWLRDFKWHNVRQLDAVSRELLVRLWAAGAGPADLTAAITIDVDSTIVPVFGRGKQGAAFGYTKVRGYHPQLAACAETGQVLFSRLRGGSAGAARGAKSFLTETFSRVRAAGATGLLTLRADSAFYSKAVMGTAAKFGVRFSITARQDKRILAAIEAINDAAWTPIPYWLSTPEVSGADVA